MTTKKEEAICILCKNIRKLRKKEKLSKKQMAQKLGIGVSSLTQIEGGKLPPRLNARILFLLHDSFGISPAEILTEHFKAK